MMNEVVLVGRLTKDPEVVTTENNKKRALITLAVPRKFKNVDGIYETDFIRIVLWNVIALNTKEYCKSGDLLGVKGRIQDRKSTRLNSSHNNQSRMPSSA